MPTISDLTIAVLTYRRQKQLELCLKSIKDQKFQPKDILVIDSFKRKTSIPISRNIALNKCQTKYLAFVDDDCILDKNWINSGYRFLKSHPKLAYVVGQTKLLNPQSTLALSQYSSYQNWFSHHHTLDTKNVIFNLSLIKDLRFDPKFKIFEDIDFSLQLKAANIYGLYCPKMIVHHPELTSPWKVIKKSYVRGKFKSILDQKWGSYDDFVPTPLTLLNFIRRPFDCIFTLGYLFDPPPKTTIVTNPDLGANGERLEAITSFLRKNRRVFSTINSELLFDQVTSSKKYLLIYGPSWFVYKLNKFINDRFHWDRSAQIKISAFNLRAKIVHRQLLKHHTNLAILSYPEDMAVCLIPLRPYRTLYDSPTIYYRELELANTFSSFAINSIKTIESGVYKNSDFVCFHWYTYFDLAKKYKLKIKHPLILNWGCPPKSLFTAPPSLAPKIVHLGKLNSYWSNPKLLSDISQKVKVDIYSYESPSPRYYSSLKNFKGYLSSHDTLSKYHFGLVSLSTDDLRSAGFSAKYLLYLSYGLPILCPSWRRDPLLSPATIYYNETNIQKVIVRYQDKKLWLKKHQAALKLAKKLNWDNTLLNLLKILP